MIWCVMPCSGSGTVIYARSAGSVTMNARTRGVAGDEENISFVGMCAVLLIRGVGGGL